MVIEKMNIEELEKLIGKSCDLIEPITGKCFHKEGEMFITGVKIVSGWDGKRAMDKCQNKEAYIYYRYLKNGKIVYDNGQPTNTWAVRHIGNIRPHCKLAHALDFEIAKGIKVN